ncbi:MAG TPA: glycosyltransferase family 39 protein [Roseiflexaceae bacterium]
MVANDRWKRFAVLVPAALFVGALLLRFWALDWGLPTAQHIDEPALLEVAVRLLQSGGLNPHQFVYPSLMYYLFAAAIRLSVWWSNLHGSAIAIQDLPLQNYRITTMPQMFVWSRAVTALLGAATVPALWSLGRRMFDWRAGLVGALLLMFSPYHMKNSHYMTPDAPSGLWVVVALIGVWLIATDGRWRGYLLVGVAAGLAAGTKYNAGVVALAIVAAHVYFWRRELLGPSLLRLVASGLLSILAFLATTPYALLDWPAFFESLRASSAHYARGGHGDFIGRWQVGGYARFLWGSGLLPLGCVVALLGLPFVIRRYPLASALLLVVIGAEMTLLMSYAVNFTRNILSIFPLFILLAGAGAVVLTDMLLAWLRRPALALQRGGMQLAAAPLSGGGSTSGGAPAQRPAANYDLSRLAWLSPVVLAILTAALLVQPVQKTTWQLQFWSKPHSMVDAVARVRQLPRGMRVAAEVSQYMTNGDPAILIVDRLTAHPLEWWQANGFRYLIANDDHRSSSDRDRYARLRAGARVLVEYAPRRDGVQLGPGGALLDLGEHADSMRFVPRAIAFGDQLALLGYEIQPGPLRTQLTPLDGADARRIENGQGVQMNLYWRARAQIDRDYVLYVHLLDALGNLVAQRDLPLRHEDYPTSKWAPGELVADRADFLLPPLPPGDYRVDVGVYDPATLAGLPARDPATGGEASHQLLTATIAAKTK